LGPWFLLLLQFCIARFFFPYKFHSNFCPSFTNSPLTVSGYTFSCNSKFGFFIFPGPAKPTCQQHGPDHPGPHVKFDQLYTAV
jgi:hypothetical protein